MNARQMAAMAEATRLTSQGRLLEATALIQQTLGSPVVTSGRRMRHMDEEETPPRPSATPTSPSALRAQEGRQVREAPSGGIPRAAFFPAGAHRVPPPAPARVPGREATGGPV